MDKLNPSKSTIPSDPLTEDAIEKLIDEYANALDRANNFYRYYRQSRGTIEITPEKELMLNQPKQLKIELLKAVEVYNTVNKIKIVLPDFDE